MASVLVFNEPDAFRVLDIDAPPERIVRAVNQGRWEEYLPVSMGLFLPINRVASWW